MDSKKTHVLFNQTIAYQRYNTNGLPSDVKKFCHLMPKDFSLSQQNYNTLHRNIRDYYKIPSEPSVSSEHIGKIGKNIAENFKR